PHTASLRVSLSPLRGARGDRKQLRNLFPFSPRGGRRCRRADEGRVVRSGGPSTISPMNDIRGAGGTSGGIGLFLFGLGMAVAGGWLLTNQVTVTTNGWHIWGYNGFGLSLIPLILGI